MIDGAAYQRLQAWPCPEVKGFVASQLRRQGRRNDLGHVRSRRSGAVKERGNLDDGVHHLRKGGQDRCGRTGTGCGRIAPGVGQAERGSP